ncbi:acyltransferase [Streptococcus lutetiensis]|uniref:acyltransferase n=1 Tax=Streptococcus lutetiensis TaxID=150055 RepID=UPI001BD9F7F2|nr:acyltransferase [Streptococcus lutetiensis]
MKKRQSNIELLRIISMILILAHHFSVHGGFNILKTSFTINRLWIQFLQFGGKIGVNIFVIISGYFLITSKGIKISKVLKLWLQLFFYSVSIYTLFVLTGVEVVSIKGIIKNVLPVIFTRWWFASTYFVLYLLSPYINKLLNSFSKREYHRFLALLTLFWCIIPTFTTNSFQSNPLIWFIYLYSLAGYMRLYGLLNTVKTGTCLLTSFVVSLLTYLSAVVFDLLGLKISAFSEHATYFFEMQKLPILIISVLLFLGFSKLNIGSIKLINIVSSATFGVYLIHDNAYVKEFLWQTLFKNASYAYSDMLIPYSILVIIIVYLTCTVIELIRIYLIEKKYMSWVNNVSAKIEEKINDLIKVACNRL